MSTISRKIGMGGKTLVSLFSGIAKAARGAALPLLIAASAILPARGDGLAITPATLPDGMEGVPYRQTFFVEGGDQTYYEWCQHHASWTTAACSYQVSANETPLWEGRKNSGYVAYDLPFAFPFCGKTYDKVYAGTQGFLFFENASVDNLYIRTYYLSDYTGVAPFWWDTIDVEAYVDASVANEVSFRFESFSQYGTFAYRVTLKSDGTIRYAYRQDGNTFVATDKRVIGVGVDDGVYSDYVAVGGETDGIPETDIVFQTYGLPAGLQLRDYQDPDTLARGALLTGTLNEACDVKFAVRACTNYVGVATNFYSFSIVRNPNRPPVIDAFTPADTNAVIFLNLGDTATFNVAVTDEAGDPFDVKWEFLSRGNSYYSTPETVGTETNLVFEATQARYEMQNSDYQPLLRCTVSDECWTNTVTWKVNIRRDWHVNATADPGTADGSADHPWPIPHTGGLQRGDTVFVAPGTYVWGPSDSTQIGIAGGVTFRSTGSAADTKFVFQKKGYIQARYYKNSTFQGFSFDGICFYNCDLVDCAIRNYNSADSYDGAIRGCSLLRCYVTGGTGKFHCYQTDIVDSTIAGNTINVPSTENSSARAVGEDCTLTRSIVVNNLALDGVEANVYADTTYTPVAVTNSCTIPAMTKLGPGNYEAQPSFVSLAGGDLRLRVGSACIDADNPANNTGAYKGPGVEGFIVHAFTDPVRGIFSDGSELQVVAAGETATVMVKPLTDRAFVKWIVNGEDGATTPELALENVDRDYEVEAVFEYREFYVNPTEADDSGDGSAAAPKKTVAAAAALALDGETVNLAEGTYEPFALMESPKVTLLGKGPDKTFIDGGGTNWCVRLGSKATLKNVAVVNGNHPQSSWYDYAGGVTGGTIENCVVSNCVSSRSAGGVADATVVSCLVTGNSNTSEWSGYAGGLYHCKVYNSTIVGNIRLNSNVSGAESCYLFNNIITGNKSNGGSDTYDVYDPKNANFSSSISSNVVYSANLIGVDPWFVDAANGDYRLIAGSPAIDAGGEVLGFDFTHATDLAGERRIRNGVVDYGCYEGGIVTGVPAAPVATGTSAKAGKGLPFVWSAIPNAAEYRIYRGTSSDPASATQVGTTTATNYLDLATTGGTDYFYWVSAWNSQFGESEKCGPIEVTSYADLKIETASLPAATEAVPYSAQLECSGNVGAATWSLPYTVYTRARNTFDGSVGTAMETPFPSEYYGCCYVELPFTFTWFGTGYRAVTVSTKGGIYFGKTTEWLSWGSTSMSSDMPKIAVLEGVSNWGDYSTISGVSVATNADDSVTILCTGTYGGYSSHPVEFSVTFSPDNTVRLAYGEDCIYGGYVAWSNGSGDTTTQVYRTRDVSFADMDDIVITSLPNESHLALSEGGLLSGVENDAGTYAITALVTDGANGDTAWKIFTLTVAENANKRPVVDTTSPATGGSSDPAADIPTVIVPAGDSQAFAVTAHDPEGAALHYDWYLDDTPVSSAGASWTYAPAQSDVGRHSLVCEVSDSLWTNGQVYAVWDILVGSKYYVDAANGTTNGTGTAESPFKTLQQAEEWIGPGSTVLVAPGTYAPIRVWGGGYVAVTFRATGSAAETIIDAGGNNTCVDDWNCTKEFTFVGFTLRNGGYENSTGAASYGVNLRDCVVTGCTGGRCTVYGADVENCTIYGNTATRYGSAVGFCTVVNSLIYGNTAGGTGVVYRSTLDHCTVYGNTALLGGGLDATSTADHSIVWGNTATADASAANYVAPAGGVQFTVSCTTPLPAAGEGNIAQDPQFVDAAGGDFRLADGSPCKEPGMGYSATGVVPVGTTYTVTFDANGGTPATTTRSVAKGKALGTLPAPTRAGYTLAGWFTAKSGGTQVTAETKVSKDVTYYAQWTEIPTYTVTFDANGGTCATKTRKVAQGEAVGELPEATRDGYTLDGWFTAKTGGSRSVATDIITKNITLYARWTEHYELVIDENGVLTGLTGTTPATVDVPATVTAFAANLFSGVAKITAVTGGANVTKCGAGAFRDSGIWKAAPNGPVVVCGVLVGYKGTVPATLDVPNGVRVIADGAFAGATSLATVYLPDSLVSIGDGAFKDCTKLDDVFGLEDGVTVADNAFEDTLYATFRLTWSGTVVTGFKGPIASEIVIPANATGIGVGAFKDQTAITSLSFEGTNLTIGANAFQGCTGLAEVELPTSLATIGASAFENCTSLVAFDIPAAVSTIGANTFKGCTSLATVTGGGSVETIRTDAFAGTPWYDAAPAGAFEEVMLGHVLVRMKGEVPASYEISTNVWMVANNAFAGVTTLSDLYIGTEVVSLWDRAFAGCTSLGSVTVPSGCRELGDYLFEGCTSLTNVFFRGHAPTNDVPNVFSGTPETLKVRVKEGSRGWIAPGSDSDLVPARWPYKTGNGEWGTGNGVLVPNDLNRAIADPEDIPGVVRSVIVDGNITNDTTWIGGKVYEVQQGCTVEGNATLTIEAGAIVKLPLVGRYANNQFRSHGKLVVNGTRANPVVFTSIRDDSWGGDTNGDGDRSEPYPGECCGVFLYGQNACIEATYAKFLYGHAENNFNAHACLMAHYVGSPSTLYGCEFSHAAMDGCFITAATLENCLFTDCDRGLVSVNNDASFSYMDGFYDRKVSAVNCVAYGNRAGFWSHTSSMYITNCISAFNSEYGISGDGSAVYSTRSCLWNPDGGNTRYQNYRSWIYNVDNIEADPLFLDAENGDFRISVESPCVDAAYGDVAPELDFWGQPRMDVPFARNTGRSNAEGVFPDIGLYEVPGTTERPVMNLEVTEIAARSASAPYQSIAPGETLEVTYTVRNTGTVAAKGSIRDTVRIKSAANGGTMVAGTVTQNYNLEPGASAALVASVALPAAPAGEWLVGIDVNPNRDVFEQNFLKNSLWTEDAIEVRLLEMSCGDGILAVTVPAGTTMGWTLANLPAEGGVVVISGALGDRALPVVARTATGHMPTAVMNDATSFVRADGSIVLVIPPRGSVATSATLPEVYLAIENTGVSAELINVTVQPLTTELWSVYPEEAANVGDMGFTFTGAGLTAASEFYLGSIRAKSVSVIDSANVYAVFNVQGISADRYYDATADGKTIRDAVRINKVAKGPILEAKLELPERTRDNRIYTGYVVYENTGDTQMNAPTFIINIAEASSTNTVIGAYDDDDDNLTLQRVLIVGLGSSHPAGILKPGDSGRLPFKFRPVGSYQFKLDSRYTSDEVASAVTRMNLRGGPVRFDGSSARGLANLIQKGEEAAAISGWLLDVRTREPLADAGLGLTLQTGNGEQGTGNGEEPFVRTATTDANGYFSFEQLRDGAYQLSADVGYVLVTTNLITVAGQADVNGYEATALPPGVVTGYAMRDDGNPVQYGDVTLYAAGDMVGTTVKTDGYGAYRFTGLEDGTYTVYAKPFESFRGVMVTNVVIEAAGRERRIDMELKRTARAYGTVTMYNGGTAVDGEVRLYDDEGNFLKADVATNGVWEAAGIPVGEYSFAYVSADGALDSARVVAAFAQGDEREIALEARPAIMFRASTRFGAIDTGAGEKLEVRFAATGYANNTNVVAVQWDFGEGDPVEVDEVETTHTYATTGYKTVRLRPKYADGTYGDWDETENYIFVSAPVETIYKANAIVLQGFDDAGAVTNAGTLVVTGVGTNWLELAGTGGIPLEAGVVIAGSYTNAENEADWFVRKVVAVSGDAGGWRLATEYGDEDDLYEQYWSNWGFGATEEEISSGTPQHAGRLHASRGPARLMAGDKKKGFGDRAKGLLPKIYGEGGVTFNVMCSPDITCFYSYYRLNIQGTNYVTRRFRDYHEMVPEVYGDMHRELRIFGDVSLTANIDISAEYSGGWKKEYQYDLLPKVMKAAPQAAKIIPHFTIKTEAAGKIGGSLHGEASVIGYIDVGFTKETGKKIQWHKPDPFKGHVDMSFETAGEKEASGKLHASVGAGFGVTMKVFEVLSATADVTFSAKAEAVIPSKGPSKASINIGYDTEIAMNFIDFSWLNADWKVGLDWSIEGLSFWGMEWISPEPSFIYRQPHEKEWPARITVTDRSKTGTFVRNGGRTEVLPIRSVTWDYGQGQKFSYGKSQIDDGTYKRHRIIEFNEEGEYTVSLNVQGGIMPNIFPCQKKIKIKKPDEPEEQSKIHKDEWFGPHQDTQTSVDPNEMAGPEGNGGERFVKPGDWMTYTIYFENKADAAIAAQEVFVENKLSEYLDWSTFEMKTVSVGGQIINGLDGYMADEIASATIADLPLAAEIDQTNGLYKTRTEVRFDAATGVASWYIRVVDPAKRGTGNGELGIGGECWPDDDTAGVLQPNVNSPEGEGYIIYSVKVREDAPANMMINNSASIVFDKNPVIVTDPSWWNTVYEMAHVTVTIDGVETNIAFAVGEIYGDSLPPEPAARPGYAFGWFTGPNGTGRRVTKQSPVQSGDSKLYAHWIANAYTVHFEPNGGTGEMSNQPFVFDTPDVLDANAFKKKFYAFDGWATNETGTAVYADCAEVVNLTSVSNGVVTLYATWRWNAVEVAFDAQDGTPTPTNRLYEVGVPYGELPEIARAGFVFAGWYDGQSGTSNRVKEQDVARADVTKLYARWLKRGYTVCYNANGGSGVMGDQAFEFDKPATLDANAFSKRNYVFAGWATTATGDAVYADCAEVVNLTTDNGGVVTLYATWTFIPQPEPTPGPTVEPTPAPAAAEAPRLWTEVTGAAPTVAALYEGYFCDGAGNVKGTIQVKVGKPGKKDGLAAVSAVVIGLDGKKTKLKAAEKGKAMLAADGPTTVSLAGGDACEVTLGAKGMSGTYGAYVIDGSLNVFASKDAADKSVAATTLDKWKGAVNVAWRLAGDGSPYQTLSVNIAAKGKAKVTGTLADGTKVSASGQLIVGENWCCVPVVCAKKGVRLQFAVWLPKTATSAALPVVVGLGEDVKVGKPGSLKGGAAFRIDTAALEALLGKAVLPYLPDGLAVTGGAKWTLPKAGSVTYAKGTTTVDAAKAGENPSGLKLTYKAKDGTFKGSFKAYADVGGKPKATTVNVTGVLVDGVGYGAATVKKVGGVSVKVE